MAMDLGFFACAIRDQVFSGSIEESEFAEVADEFGLLMIQHDGPHEPVTSFLTKIFRRSPPLSKPAEAAPPRPSWTCLFGDTWTFPRRPL
jgi:hypothetical protein